MKKFVIHLTGQPATGKSTFANLISAEFPGAYSIFYDRLKWQLSGYNRERDRATIHCLQESLFEGALRLGVPLIIADFFFTSSDKYLKIKKMAESHDYVFLTIALEASLESLGQRFDERKERSKKENFKMSITDKTLFFENLKEKPYVPPGSLILDTSQEVSIGENLTRVLAFLREQGVGQAQESE